MPLRIASLCDADSFRLFNFMLRTASVPHRAVRTERVDRSPRTFQLPVNFVENLRLSLFFPPYNTLPRVYVAANSPYTVWNAETPTLWERNDSRKPTGLAHKK